MIRKGCGRSLLSGAVLLFFCLLPEARAQRPVSSVGQASPGVGQRGSDWQDFFPLEVGNEWVYSDGVHNFTVRVLGETQEANGLRYFRVSGYFPDDSAEVRKLRHGPSGQVLEYNPAGEDFLWYRFSNVRGSWRFQSSGDISCITGSWVSIWDMAAAVDVPAGAFPRALRLAFRAPCNDAGLTSEYFAGGVGLVQRVFDTIAGPRIVRLVAAHIGSADFAETAYGVEVSLDRPVYYNNLMPPVVNPWPTARATLVVRNTTAFPVEFTFPTSQRFDLIVRDAQGREVLRWSDGRAFLQVLGQEILQNESRRYAADIVLQSREGKTLPAGSYSLTGYLTTQDAGSGLPGMLGTVRFEIRDIH
jgi:hypothetical protein